MQSRGASCIIIQNFRMEDKKGQLRIQATTNRRFLELGFSKKGQLRIQEMALMLIAVFFFFTLVGLFIFAIVYANLQDSATKIAEDRTISSVISLSNSPELSCVASRSNCVDEDKLISLVGKTAYQNFWPFSSLKVYRLSAFDKDESELVVCNTGNYPRCDLFIVYDKNVANERSVSTFITLCRKELDNGYTYDKCEVAKIVAGTQLNRGEK